MSNAAGNFRRKARDERRKTQAGYCPECGKPIMAMKKHPTVPNCVMFICRKGHAHKYTATPKPVQEESP